MTLASGMKIGPYAIQVQAIAFYLHQLGVFSNLELLKMWCENTPEDIFPKRKIGRLREGYEASFIVLLTNPVENFDAVNAIKLRFKQGHLL